MDEETRKELKDYYSHFNEKLFEILGYRVDEWD